MHICPRTVKVSCIQTLEIEVATDISWNKEASGASAYKYSAAVLGVQKQYDWEHGPITRKRLAHIHSVFEKILENLTTLVLSIELVPVVGRKNL